MPIPEILSALADENRRMILSTLKQGPIASGELAQKVGMTPQALSYHLKKLREAELIYETRQKNFIYYELDLTVLDEAILWLDELKGGESREVQSESPVRNLHPADGSVPDRTSGSAPFPS